MSESPGEIELHNRTHRSVYPIVSFQSITDATMLDPIACPGSMLDEATLVQRVSDCLVELPWTTPENVPDQDQQFVEAVTTGDVPVPKPRKSPFRIVALDDLTGEQIDRFVRAKGVTDIKAFKKAMERTDAWSFRRPANLWPCSPFPDAERFPNRRFLFEPRRRHKHNNAALQYASRPQLSWPLLLHRTRGLIEGFQAVADDSRLRADRMRFPARV